jgi:MscS family membrane protein
VNVPSLLAGLGIGGLAVALAAKETLANLFGSMTILLDGPFQIGDYVSVDGVEGTVEEVGLRSTRIRTFQDSLVVFPNAKLADSKIDNFQRRRQRRCLTTWRLAHDTSPEQVQAFVEGVRAIVRGNPLTRKDAYEVHMSEIGPGALDIIVQFFLKVDTWTEELRQKHNILLECLRLAHDLGVRFALPTQAVHVQELAAPGGTRPTSEPVADSQLAAVVEAFGPGGSRARPAGPVVTKGFWPTPEAEA